MTVGACENTTGTGTGATGASYSSTPQTALAGCNTQSKYTAPVHLRRDRHVRAGIHVVPIVLYPEQRAALHGRGFRTSWKNDTLLFRPYTQVINRFISGDFENQYPGNAGSWYQVTSVANCQVKFLAPGVTAGGGLGGGRGGTVLRPATVAPTVTRPTSGPMRRRSSPTRRRPHPTCTVATPCYTTNTSQQNNRHLRLLDALQPA